MINRNALRIFQLDFEMSENSVKMRRKLRRQARSSLQVPDVRLPRLDTSSRGRQGNQHQHQGPGSFEDSFQPLETTRSLNMSKIVPPPHEAEAILSLPQTKRKRSRVVPASSVKDYNKTIKNETSRPGEKPRSSSYRGVSFKRKEEKWVSQIKYKGTQHYLGLYFTAEEAARAYDRRLRQYYGPQVPNTNFVNDAVAAQVCQAAAAENGTLLADMDTVDKKKQPTSSFRGVSFKGNENMQKWVAQIRYNGKQHYLGLYKTEEEAAVAYDKAAVRYHGAKARTNFTKLGQQDRPRQGLGLDNGVGFVPKQQHSQRLRSGATKDLNTHEASSQIALPIWTKPEPIFQSKGQPPLSLDGPRTKQFSRHSSPEGYIDTSKELKGFRMPRNMHPDLEPAPFDQNASTAKDFMADLSINKECFDADTEHGSNDAEQF